MSDGQRSLLLWLLGALSVLVLGMTYVAGRWRRQPARQGQDYFRLETHVPQSSGQPEDTRRAQLTGTRRAYNSERS
jgi:hypothetical protein